MHVLAERSRWTALPEEEKLVQNSSFYKLYIYRFRAPTIKFAYSTIMSWTYIQLALAIITNPNYCNAIQELYTQLPIQSSGILYYSTPRVWFRRLLPRFIFSFTTASPHPDAIIAKRCIAQCAFKEMGFT